MVKKQKVHKKLMNTNSDCLFSFLLVHPSPEGRFKAFNACRWLPHISKLWALHYFYWWINLRHFSLTSLHGRGDSRSQASLTYIFTQQIIYGRPTVPSTSQALRMLPWIKLTELLVWGVWHSSGEREFRWTSTICGRSCGYKFKGEELNREGEHSTKERGCSLKRLIRECGSEKLIIWTDSNLVSAPFLFPLILSSPSFSLFCLFGHPAGQLLILLL